MDNQFTLPSKFKNATYVLMAIGVIVLVIGLLTNPERAWTNFLLNNYYFLSIAIGATFFIAIQYITQSGWATMLKRVPEAMGMYIPIAAILMLLLYFGAPFIYHWAHTDSSVGDDVLQHNSGYLNLTFFIFRIALYFAIWIFMIRLLRKESLKEDVEGGLQHFRKSETYSKIYIFILAITFSAATFDWIMSVDAHWISTIFAFKNFVAAFYHAVAVIALIVIVLNRMGYFKLLNKYHLHDFSRYIFILGIVWMYMWFCQYLLIWYANMPEETVYYHVRLEDGWKVLFFGNVALNWAIPFTALLWQKADRSKIVLSIVCVVLIIGQWVDLYLQITPGSLKELHIGYIEIGTFLGFAGLFAFVVGRSLGKAPLIPKNHPYLEESMYHQF